MSADRRTVSFTIHAVGAIDAAAGDAELDELELSLRAGVGLVLFGALYDPRVELTRNAELHDRTVYVVVPLGMVNERATDADLAGVQLALLPFVTHRVTDPRLCGDITAHLMANLLAGV